MARAELRDRFDRVYSENVADVVRFTARRCDPIDAADVTAEVFTIAWTRLADVPVGEERLWLFGVARRVLANHRRRVGRRDALVHRLSNEIRDMVVDPTVEAESLAVVRSALLRLNRRDREVLLMSAWDGLTSAEIAQVEGVPAASVRSRLMRARRRLREELDTAGDNCNGARKGADPDFGPADRSVGSQSRRC